MKPSIAEVCDNPLSLTDQSGFNFSDNGLIVTNPAKVLEAVSASGKSLLLAVVGDIRQGSVQSAPDGVVQDPAGSAIGATAKPVDSYAGGASGAIYAHFPDLEPIPTIAPLSAIFNTSTGPGERVLHCYSPDFRGALDPTKSADCVQALQDLANAYCNAFAACALRGPIGGRPISGLNLVPLSGGIFCGTFGHPFNNPLSHLHPSYTLTAILLASKWMLDGGSSLPKVSIYYYSSDVFSVAQSVATEIASTR